MRRQLSIVVICIVLLGCAQVSEPTSDVPGPDEPFPPTWTPTVPVEHTPTATLVVQPTPTWDGTPPPPSLAQVPRLLPARLYREFDSGDYVVVDLRSFAAYNQAHIEDAVHIPFEELADRVGELDGNKTIVLYDLVMSESTSLAGAMMLYERGFSQVAVLEGGLQKWLSDGYPIKGSLLTPTPAAAGPPWTVTPLITATHTSVPTVVTATSTVSPTATTAQ